MELEILYQEKENLLTPIIDYLSFTMLILLRKVSGFTNILNYSSCTSSIKLFIWLVLAKSINCKQLGFFTNCWSLDDFEQLVFSEKFEKVCLGREDLSKHLIICNDYCFL